MKILFLLHSYYKFNQGGAELQIKFIAEYLISKNFEVHYVFLHNQKINYLDNGINLRSIVKKPILDKIFGKIIYYNNLMSIIKDIQPDIIYHRHLSSFAYPVLNYCKKNNCKSFLHLALQSDVEKTFTINKKIISSIIDTYCKRKILKNFDNIIAQAKYQDELLKLNYKRKANLVLANMHPYPDRDLKKSENLKILWIANLKEWKQPSLFVKLSKLLSIKNVEFIMIGRDSNDTETKLLKKEINSITNLTYLGEKELDFVNNLLSESHIFVNTSLYEGFPNTYIQAWMREVPVVALNVDPDNVIKINNLGFHSNNFETMVKNVEELIKNTSLREEMSKNAKEYAFKKHGLKNIEQIIELFKERKE